MENIAHKTAGRDGVLCLAVLAACQVIRSNMRTLQGLKHGCLTACHVVACGASRTRSTTLRYVSHSAPYQLRGVNGGQESLVKYLFFKIFYFFLFFFIIDWLCMVIILMSGGALGYVMCVLWGIGWNLLVLFRRYSFFFKFFINYWIVFFYDNVSVIYIFSIIVSAYTWIHYFAMSKSNLAIRCCSHCLS